jgi:hypothetical protein
VPGPRRGADWAFAYCELQFALHIKSTLRRLDASLPSISLTSTPGSEFFTFLADKAFVFSEGSPEF